MSGLMGRCEHPQLICSSGWRCALCGADLDTMRWQFEQRERRALTDALNELSAALKTFALSLPPSEETA
jgi:hypothetical protein